MMDERPPGQGNNHPGASGRSFTDSEIEELLPSFVLGALDADEMLAVADFLQQQPRWQARVARLEETMASLAHAAPRTRLPAQAKARLLRRMGAEAPSPATRRTPFFTPPPERPARPVGAGLRGLRSIPRPRPTMEPTGRSWLAIFGQSLAVAGAAAAIIILAGVSWQLHTSVNALSAQLAAAQGELAQVRQEMTNLAQINTTLQQQLQAQNAQVALLTDPDQSIVLTGTEAAPLASGEFVRRDDKGLLILRGLPTLPADQTYQLWILQPDAPSVPANLLQVANTDTATIELTLGEEYRDYAGVGISIEPAGGSLTPTTIVLVGQLTAPSA
jgi:anti-sigma-K factor RskA